MDSKPLAHVPLSVFSQSSSLMSDRASQAMEKALRNKPRPRYHSSQCNYGISFSTLSCCFLFVLYRPCLENGLAWFGEEAVLYHPLQFRRRYAGIAIICHKFLCGEWYIFTLAIDSTVEGGLRIPFTTHGIVSLHPKSLLFL